MHPRKTKVSKGGTIRVTRNYFDLNTAPLKAAKAIAISMLFLAPTQMVLAQQSVSLTPAPIAEHTALVDDWQQKKDALIAARKTLADFEAEAAKLSEGANAQQAKVDSAKTGLSSAVLKVAGAKKRLSRVDTSTDDPEGEELSNKLLATQTDLNTVISASESLQADIKDLKAEHEKLRSTVDQLKNAAAAAKAAFSAAQVLVEAVKSAQEVIAEGDAETSEDFETDFFKDAVAQAENAQKSEEAAKAALAATRKRQIVVGEALLKADEQLANAKNAETNAYEKFATADAAFKKHQAERKEMLDERNALIAEINNELNTAQDELEAQQAILQNESLKMQDFTAEQEVIAQKLEELNVAVDTAKNAFDASQGTLRADQRARAVQGAAIVADLNAEMRTLIMPSVASADTSSWTDRVILPASALFSENSAQLQTTDGVKINEIAAILRDTTSRIPDGIEWLIRVDSYGAGTSDDTWFLSQNRALSLAQNLIKAGKFEPNQISANGLIGAAPFSDATQNGWLEIVLTSR